MVVGIVPKWGRTSRYVLKRLGESSGQDLSSVISTIKGSKEYLTKNPDEAEAYLQSLREQGFKCFSLSPDRKRESHPDRIGLRRLDLVIDGINVRIEGDEPHNGSSLIRLDEADFTFAGLDELLIHNQQWMYDKGRMVRTWGNHNYQLEAPTDVKVAGSAGIISSNGLQDFIGMFLIGNPQKRPVKNIDPQVLNGTVPLFVKGRYEGLVLNVYPNAKTVVVENVEKDITLFSVKQEDFTLSRFLGNDILAQEFDGGTMMIFRLSPYNYHHYHGAVDAIPSEGTFIKKIGLESVDPIAYKTKIDPLITNKRMLVKLDTPYGIIPMVVVGAYNVGSINNTYIPCQEYKKGAELGYFKLGGSTVVLLFKKGQIIPIKEFVEHSLQGFETAVFLGEKVATFTQSLTEEEIKVWKKSTTTLCEKP